VKSTASQITTIASDAHIWVMPSTATSVDLVFGLASGS
jgi:hypothetical protein